MYIYLLTDYGHTDCKIIFGYLHPLVLVNQRLVLLSERIQPFKYYEFINLLQHVSAVRISFHQIELQYHEWKSERSAGLSFTVERLSIHKLTNLPSTRIVLKHIQW
jgi:hypothetical protein